MSHELEDNKERRQHILGKMRQWPNGVPLQKLKSMIMEEFGYNLRGASDKVKELAYMGLIKEKDLYWFPGDSVSHTHAREKERVRVTKASVQEETTRQEET